MKLKNKAQIQMTENVIILFIFFILLIFAIVFFTRIQSGKQEIKISEDIQNRGLQIAQTISTLPELRCTKKAVTVLGCYDQANALALQSLVEQNNGYYFDQFSYSTVSIVKIFPESEDEQITAYDVNGNPILVSGSSPIVIYNNPKANFTSLIPTQLPMLLCDFTESTEKGDCSFAILNINVYS